MARRHSQARFAPEEFAWSAIAAGPAEWLPRCDKSQGPPSGIGGMVQLRQAGAFLLRANSGEPHPSPWAASAQ
jgi:hypothetical protein